MRQRLIERQGGRQTQGHVQQSPRRMIGLRQNSPSSKAALQTGSRKRPRLGLIAVKGLVEQQGVKAEVQGFKRSVTVAGSEPEGAAQLTCADAAP